ncbi:MAG: Fe-S cluster assembly protein SufD [Actinomycetota bacterium]
METTTLDHSAARLVGDHSHLVVPKRDRAERVASFDPADFPMPTGREEDWRFTPVDRLAALLASGPTGTRLTLSSRVPDGVTLTEVDSATARAVAPFAPGDRAAALAVANSDGALRLEVPASFAGEPVVLNLHGTGGAVFGHLSVHVGANAEAIVVLRHTGTAEYSARVDLTADEGAHVTFVSLQEWDEYAVHLAENAVAVAKDATVKHVVVTLGGELARVNTSARFTGIGGNLELLGLYYTDAGQHQEHRLFVDHAVPNCVSRATYKGALQGEGAHSVWVGDVLIRKAAEGTDTYELNRNLVLTEGARADSVPNLEIETGEIEGAGHASATGRFDDEQLFYLRSRGIPELQARRLVVRGFFAELISQIGVPEVQGELMDAIEAELGRSQA